MLGWVMEQGEMTVARAGQDPRHFYEKADSPPPSPCFDGYTWEERERDYLHFLLKKYKWNVTRAARAAGLKRSTFGSRMKRLGISR